MSDKPTVQNIDNPDSINDSVLKEVFVVGGLWESTRTRYINLSLQLKEDGCTLKDVLPHMQKRARKEGLYQTKDEWALAEKLGINWAKRINLYVAWVSTNMNGKWELKSKDTDVIKKITDRIDAQEAFDALTPEEQAVEKEKKKAEQQLRQEISIAQSILKNADAFKRLAEKEGIKTPVDTILATLKDAVDSGRIGK